MNDCKAIRSGLRTLGACNDPTLANICLICIGGMLACVGLVCCLCGIHYITVGDIDASRALIPYFSRSVALACLAFWAVRGKRRRRRP